MDIIWDELKGNNLRWSKHNVFHWTAYQLDYLWLFFILLELSEVTETNQGNCLKGYLIIFNNTVLFSILLFSAESEFAGSRTKYKTLVVISSNGENIWMSPATFQSSCLFDVSFFPFDIQFCKMTFGSWTLTNDKMTLKPMTRSNLFAGMPKFIYTNMSPHHFYIDFTRLY